MATPAYSQLISCVYDEPGPIGYLGRGTHYSIFRCAEWHNVVRAPLIKAEVHDFAIIWDEDHDTRVIRIVENIYMEGLLSPIQFIGERKGTLTVILAAKFYWAFNDEHRENYIARLRAICQSSVDGDVWPLEIGMFDRSPGSPHQTDVRNIINANEHQVITYLRNIDSLWQLGTRPFSSANVAS